MKECPHCRAVVAKSVDFVATAWRCETFACGSFAYIDRASEQVLNVWRSAGCREAMQEFVPSEMGKPPLLGNRKPYRRWMTDDEGRDVS